MFEQDVHRQYARGICARLGGDCSVRRTTDLVWRMRSELECV